MKVVIFDVDNVVMNFREQQALSWREALRHFCQYEPIETIRRKLAEHGTESVRFYFSAHLLNKYRRFFINHVSLVFKEKYQPRIHVRPQMSDLLAQLRHNNLKIGLLSTTGQLAGNKRLAHIEAFLRAKTYFAADETDESLGATLRDILAFYQITEPMEATAICATPTLARAACALGVNAIGLTCSGFAEVELRAAGCHEVYATPTELLQVFENSFWAPPSPAELHHHKFSKINRVINSRMCLTRYGSTTP